MPPAKPLLSELTEWPGQLESDSTVDMGVLPGLMVFMLRQGLLCVCQDIFHNLDAEDIRPPQLSILEIVGRNPGIRPSDVSTAVGIKRANLVPLVAALKEKGFLTRAPAETDRRAQALQITPEGAEKLQHWLGIVRLHEDRLAQRLGAQGCDTLLKLLQTLVNG